MSDLSINGIMNYLIKPLGQTLAKMATDPKGAVETAVETAANYYGITAQGAMNAVAIFGERSIFGCAVNERYIVVVDVSKEIEKSGATAGGYNGGEEKVKVENGGLITTDSITGTNPGLSLEFNPAEISGYMYSSGAQYLALDIKGSLFNYMETRDHYATIWVEDKNGERFTLYDMCNMGTTRNEHEDCYEKSVTKMGEVEEGTSLKMGLPQGLESIRKIGITFDGTTLIDKGFNISNIALVKSD